MEHGWGHYLNRALEDWTRYRSVKQTNKNPERSHLGPLCVRSLNKNSPPSYPFLKSSSISTTNTRIDQLNIPVSKNL